jgi:hypothetical protein
MLRFLPWKFIVQRAARAYGFADPALWLARIRNFAQPSEVAEPIELVRAGFLFHARGIVNAKAIQHNLDWVWPYWVERQFDPEDISFVPRAFSLSHINLTHRNWTAVGLPELAIYPIVDPRGLVTPLHDGWSIDFWLAGADGSMLVPSRLHDESFRQTLNFERGLSVESVTMQGELEIEQSTRVVMHEQQPALEIDVRAAAPGGGSLVMAIRPYNPEGVQFIDHLKSREAGDGWCVNSKTAVISDRPADAALVSDYASGDVFARLNEVCKREGGCLPSSTNGQPSAAAAFAPGHAVKPVVTDVASVRCNVGMATGASVYRFDGPSTQLTVRVPLGKELEAMANPQRFNAAVTWNSVREGIAELQLPDERLQYLYDAAVRTLVLLSADDVVPGPYTYRRFWFRDACLMMNTLLAIGLDERVRRGIERFPERQLRNGYFRSQEGEWDSNGQVLWIADRYEQLSGNSLASIHDSLMSAVEWIDGKRVRDPKDPLHAGLLPAGFSAEHLGPNDHYYWDDFWAEGGLRAAARLFARAKRQADAERARTLVSEMRAAIERSLERIPKSRAQDGIPASPYRRMDAGAIGSLVADYPLMLFEAGDSRIMATVEAILRHHIHKGGFFQDMIHSGMNAYLTLDIAQTLLRAGDSRYRDLMETIARLASPTGQWPEAIHPHTLGGCMGDGQHGWAAAEWVMMIRNCFVREERDRLVIGSGLFEEWFESDDELRFGPTLTPWGRLTVRVVSPRSEPTITIDGTWRDGQPRIDVIVPGFVKLLDVDSCSPLRLQASSADFADVRR